MCGFACNANYDMARENDRITTSTALIHEITTSAFNRSLTGSDSNDTRFSEIISTELSTHQRVETALYLRCQPAWAKAASHRDIIS
jgi:hypothetical protein